MASSALGFSSWRRRSSSFISQDESSREGNEGSSPPAGSVDLPASSARHLSSSISSAPGHREPIRSYIHSSVREHLVPVDSEQNARTVREDTEELASYFLLDNKSERSPSFLKRKRPSAQEMFGGGSIAGSADDNTQSTTIPEGTEPPSPSASIETTVPDGPSVLANLLRTSPPGPSQDDPSGPSGSRAAITQAPKTEDPDSLEQRQSHTSETTAPADEQTPLLRTTSTVSHTGAGGALEEQKERATRRWISDLVSGGRKVEHRFAHTVGLAFNPRRWDGDSIWRNAVVAPVSCLPAVLVGLLLNILDALSYGMILFPLGKSIFSHLGSAGISIFYVSTIVSQLIFSSGSIFRGAVGSELIEVVPFFHNMAEKITVVVGAENPDAVIATTIVSYALSSMMTGLVFYLMGKFKFGYMVGFIPRHILIGCIGGVGWFLIATGFEVSARLDGNLEYNLDTLQQLTQPDTIPLWLLPLLLAVFLFYGQAKFSSKYFLPLFIMLIPVVFYFLVLSLDALDTDALRDGGWIFEGPPAGEPWWYFYTLYKFQLVRWDAVAETIPAMLALTFFGILHVPINVPALALNCGEDNADLDKELRLHGYSNFLSGCFGSIQNYLVYANTVFFMRSGGDSRLAGYLLAMLTFGVMMIGPSLIGFIPVMMVGTLIFDLGFELLLEAVWLPRKKLRLAEFLTVLCIVLVMGIYDFVTGIALGILLAFISLTVQTSRISAIRGSFAGDVVTSTVRRNPSQFRYLQQVGQQIYIIKLTGFLFFGTVVSVEEKIRALLDDAIFGKKPIKFLVLDLWHVTGLDYSAGEAFNTISRLLDNKGVIFVLSGVHADSQLERHMRAVGLGNNGIEVMMLPDLNSALESCENELLKTLYTRQEEMNATRRTATETLEVPTRKPSTLTSFDAPFNSPRKSHQVEAAQDALTSIGVQRSSKWQSFKEPLRLMLQVFQGLSDKNEDFWFQAASYFKRREYAAGTTLFHRGEQADGFYLVERGILRAEYDLPQGWLCESIVAGTTCGELPFFSETDRTATAQVEKDCVVWLMDREAWRLLQKQEPEIARELLRISLKLTTERMSAITSYTLTIAG